MAKNSFKNGWASLVFVGASFLAVTGCAPRGESHSVDQILSDARGAYMQVVSSVGGDTAASLKYLSGSLDKLAGIGGGGDAKAVSGEIATALTDLGGKVGYTVRPALAELVSQYRTVADGSTTGASLGAPNLKLLVARTYLLMTSELKTTQFKVA